MDVDGTFWIPGGVLWDADDRLELGEMLVEDLFENEYP